MITHVLHFADIHIRAGDVIQSRKDEYMHVFQNLEAALDRLECVRAGTAIAVVCGDVFHHKYRLEGPAVQLWIRFVRILTDRMRVWIISGNHDFRQERPNDPDLLEVMMDTLPPLRNKCSYICDSGVFVIDNEIEIGVVAIRETLKSYDTSGLVTDLPEFPRPSKDDNVHKRIALFHGTITQSSLPNGQCMTAGKGYPLEWFAGYDIVMLGDNHLQQWHVTKDGMSWGYPGSLLQQDFGEPVYGHGFLLWDLVTKTAQPYHVTNEFGRIRAKVAHDNVYVRLHPTGEYMRLNHELSVSLPRTPIVSVIGNTGDECIVSTALRLMGGIVPTQIATTMNTSAPSIENSEYPTSEVDNLAVVHNPTKWLEYIESTDPSLASTLRDSQWLEHPDRILAGVEDVAEVAVGERATRIQMAIDAYKTVRECVKQPARITLSYLEWAWAFAYGEHNWFDFDKMDGDITLLNGKNASGKSSFIDILCIALFGEPGKNRNINATKRMSSMMIHHQKPARVPMYCTVVFRIESAEKRDEYAIERVYTPHKTKMDEYGIQMSKCDLYRLVDGTTKELICSGATLVEAWVQEHCGTIDDMMESTVVSQMDIHNFFMLKPDAQKYRLDESLNMECVQHFGNILKQAILAFNSWIETLGVSINSQRACIADAGWVDTDEDSAGTDLSAEVENRADRVKMLEAECDALLLKSGGIEGSGEDDAGTGIDIPDDVIDRRAKVCRDLEIIGYVDSTRGFDSPCIYDGPEFPLRPYADVVTERDALVCDIDQCEFDDMDIEEEFQKVKLELADWRNCVDEFNNIEAEVSTEQEWRTIYDKYRDAKSRCNALGMSYSEWCKKWDEWNRVIAEAGSCEWPAASRCARSYEKSQASLGKWDRLEHEASVIVRTIEEKTAEWKLQYRAFREKEKRCNSCGLKTLDEVMLWNKLIDTAESWEEEWTAWTQLNMEKQLHKWHNSAECRKWLRCAVVANGEYNPDCPICCKYRNASLREMGVRDMEHWIKAVRVCTEIEERKEVMERRKRERDADTERVACATGDARSMLKEWLGLDDARTEIEKKKRYFENSVYELQTQLEQLKKRMSGIAKTREDIVYTMEEWKRAYEIQSMIENRRDWMDAAAVAWDTMLSLKRDACASWRHNGDKLQKRYDDLLRVVKYLKNGPRLAQEEAFIRWRHRELVAELERLNRLRAVAALRYAKRKADLSAAREELREMQNALEKQRRAAALRQEYESRISAKEVVLDMWRTRRDILQATYQRLIGEKDDKHTYKEWVYASFVIPLLERHVNSFLGSVAMTTSPRLEIEYHAKALRFTVVDRGNRTTYGLSSGFQKFIIGLALRMALIRLGGGGHMFTTLIIDEGFVACDADNVQYARDILYHMMEVGGFHHILLATHLDTIKDMIGRKIHIEREGGFSRLQVGSRRQFGSTTPARRGRPPKELKQKGQ